MTDTPASNPLAEATVDSLSHLMSLNPADLSDKEKLSIIKAFREQRERWLAEEAAGVRHKSRAAKVAGDEPAKTKRTVSTKIPAPAGFSLKDIGL